MDRIEVCFAIHDPTNSYAKYLGVAVSSIIENTNMGVKIHILHDETLSELNKSRLNETVRMSDNEVVFYSIDSAKFSPVVDRLGLMTVGTLFRLMITDVLPSDISKVIYLDADIVVNIDLSELWSIDLEDCWLAGCLNQGLSFSPYPCRKKMLPESKYFNAGVLLLDLRKIRNNINLFDDTMTYLKNNPSSNLHDQDALNVVFFNHVKLLPEKFNYFTSVMRSVDLPERQGIYHFAGDYVHVIDQRFFDGLFFQVWSKSKWWDLSEVLFFQRSRENVLIYRREAHELFLTAVAERREICIWGAGSILNEMFDKKYNDVSVSFYVDANKALEGTLHDGVEIYAPEYLWSKTVPPFVIVFSKKYFREIKRELEDNGYMNGSDFINGAFLFPYEDGGMFPGL